MSTKSTIQINDYSIRASKDQRLLILENVFVLFLKQTWFLTWIFFSDLIFHQFFLNSRRRNNGNNWNSLLHSVHSEKKDVHYNQSIKLTCMFWAHVRWTMELWPVHLYYTNTKFIIHVTLLKEQCRTTLSTDLIILAYNEPY